jgi:hypothetical protein
LGKVLKIVAVVAVAAAIAYFAPQISAAILASTASAATTAAVTAAVAATLAISASAVMTLLAGKPRAAEQTPGVFRQAVANSFLIYGKRRVGGLLIFFHPRTSGKDQYRYFVIAVAGHQCKGVTRWFLGDDEVSVDGSGKILNGTYANSAWLWFYRGTPDQAAHPTFVSETGGKWSANHRARGTALIYAKFKMTDDVVQAGMPNITAEVEGKDTIVDVRDDTVGYTRNAQLIFRDWMALPREEGGFGAYPDELDDDWDALNAGVCDEDVPITGARVVVGANAGATSIKLSNVAGLQVGTAATFQRQSGESETRYISAVYADGLIDVTNGFARSYEAGSLASWSGSTEKRYEFDAYITTGAPPSEIRDTFVTCCAGTFTYSGGKMLMRPGYYVPPSATLSEDDLAGAITVPALLGGDEISNEITGTFVDPSTLYQPADVPTRSTYSDDVRQQAVDLPHITSVYRGQRILEYLLRKSQAERRVTWPMNIAGLAVSTLDTVQIATARYGLSNYSFQVTGWGLSQDFSVVLQLEEHGPELFEFDPASYLEPGEVPTLVRADPIVDENLGSISTAIANSYPTTNPLTAADGGTVTIANHVRRYPDGTPDVAVTGGTIATGLAPGDFVAIGYDDQNRAGGAVTYIADANDLNVRVSPSHPYRHYVGYAFIPTAGSPPSSGGGATPPGGNCPTVDTPILMADRTTKPAGEIAVGDEVYTRHEIGFRWGSYPVEAVSIVDSDDVWQATVGGKLLRATGDHLVYTGEWVKMRDLGTKIAGTHQVVKITVTSAHTYVSNGVLSHNIKQSQPTLD